MDEDVALDQAVKFCQIQMATSAQRQVGHTHWHAPGNNIHWLLFPLECKSNSPLFTLLESESRLIVWMFSHLPVLLSRPTTPSSFCSHTNTHLFLCLLWETLIMHLLLVSLHPFRFLNNENFCLAGQRKLWEGERALLKIEHCILYSTYCFNGLYN